MKPRRDFNEAAATWDENPGRVKVIGDIAEAMQKRLILTPSMDVLDFGCGTGLLSLPMAERVGTLTGVDTSASMLEIFEEKARQLDLGHVHSMQLDLEQGDAIPGHYDLVVSSMVFHHIEQVPDVLKQLHAVLKPAGILCVSDLDLDGGRFHADPTGVFHEGFDRSVFSRMMEEAEFSEIEIGTAAEIVRPAEDGSTERFTIFMALGRRNAE